MKISAFYVLMFALTAAARAPAGEQRKYRTAYACEGSTLSLSCGESGEVISLVRANYGRFSITICNEHGDTDWSVNCMSHRSLRVLHAKCNQQSNCSILASTSVFGDPCPGTLKYLEAHYQCVPATPASPTPRPRPPWMFTSAGPTMWSTLALNVTAPTPTKPVTQPSTVAATEASTNATAAQESSTAEAPTESTSAATSAATTSSTSTTPPTTTPLPSLLSEQSEVTVLVPDFPGRRPHTSTAPSPTSPSTTTEKALVAEQEEEEELEVDEDHEPTTTPSPSTTATAGKKDGRPANGEQGAVYCQPTVSRGNYWNWTRAGQEASQPCPGGATGYARWYCAGTSASSAHWYPSSPDLSGCKSVWLTSLDSRIGEGDSIISIANDLASVTHSKTLYGGDMMAAAGLLKQMAVKMGKDLEAFPDWRQREAIVTELVQSVIRAGSSLLGSAQSLAWRDLGLAVSAGRSALAADGSPDGEAHYHARTTATALLTGLEENAFLLANTINRQKNYFQSYDNILLSVRVLDMRAINELSFPSSEELQVWKSKEDWIVLPVEALQENSENGLVRVVLFAYEHMEDILSPASLGGHYYPGGGSVSSPKEDGRQAANASRIVNSRVISASLGKGRHIQLPQPVTIRFQHLRQDNVSNPTCVFWDYTVSAWSDEGCRVLATNRTHTQCRCDHLTNFAVLMDLHSAPLASHHQQALAAVTYAGCGLSILCLALSLVVFALCGSQFKSDRATIHKNLCLCLLVAEVIFLAGVNATHDRIGCSVVAGLLHYAFLAAFTWMLLEGHQLYVMLVEVFESDKSRLKCYYLVGYGLPLLVVSVSAMVDPFSYGTANYCWLRADNYFIFSFVGPVIVILLANFVFLGMAIWVMNRHQTTSAVMKSKEQSRLTNARSWIRGAFALAVLLGLTWTLGLLYLNESSVIMAYAFTAVNSLQGCFVFFIVCLRSEQVRKEMRKWLRRHGWAECLSDASPSPSGPGALGKDNQTSFYGSSGSAGATLSANDTLPAAQYIAQPWRGGDVNLASPQVSNNNSSMRLNNTKNSQLRSSSRTLKQQPIIGSPHELENGSYKSYGRDSGNGSSEQDESSPRQQQIRLQQQQQQQQQQLVQQQLVQQQQQQQQQQSANGSMNRARGNNYPHPVPNPALAEGAAMDAQLIAQFRGNNSSPLRLGHHQQHLRGSNKRCRSASPWNHTYMEIDMRRGARKTLAEQDEDGMVGDPVYEEIERNACGDACPCSGHLQRAPMVHYQQASDASDEERRQNSSDVSRQSSRSYGDNRPLIPMHHHHHHHQLSNQSAPGGTHDLLTTISCAFNSPHLRTKHRHQFEPAPTHQPIHMGFDAAPHFDAERYAQRPPPMYPYQDQETGLTALSVVNGERIFVASGALLEQSPRNQPIQRPPVPFTEC